MIRTLLASVLLAIVCLPCPATADDVLRSIGASNPAAFYEVLEHVAEGAGLYKAEHLSVTKQFAGSAALCAQFVATGKGDVCTMSVEPIIMGYDKGLRLQLIFADDPRYTYVLGVLDDSPIRTLADFKGKEIGVTNAGSTWTSQISANDMLTGAGLKPSDYSFVPIGVGAQALTALTSKRVDGAAFPAVELGQIGVSGHVKFRYFRDPILDTIPDLGFAATPDTVRAKADELRRYLRAIVKAAILVRENPPVAARYFLEGKHEKVTPETLQNQIVVLETLQGDLSGADPSNPRIGYVPLKGIALLSGFFYAGGLTSRPVPAADIVSNEFIAYANDFDKKAFIAHVKGMR